MQTAEKITDTCSLPASVSIQLTEACNLRCKMCYEWGEKGGYGESSSRRKPASLDIAVLKQLVRDLTPARPMYDLFGGEPLVYPDLEEFILAVKEAGSSVDTPTNGTLLKRHAAMLVRTGFDSVRVSIDGPQEVNDVQRGRGSYERAMKGIEMLDREKQKAGSLTPAISIIFTITRNNYDSIEQFFLHELNLSAIDWVTIQMQNYITAPMGLAYARLLEKEFGITSDRYWKGLVGSPDDFRDIDSGEVARQVNNVSDVLQQMGKNVLLLPPTFSPDNLRSYLGAKWTKMSDMYRSCPIPWSAADITATGDVAPCHIFYDLTMGNVYKDSFENIWNGRRYLSFRSYMEKSGLMPICHGCCILYLAGS